MWINQQTYTHDEGKQAANWNCASIKLVASCLADYEEPASRQRLICNILHWILEMKYTFNYSTNVIYRDLQHTDDTICVICRWRTTKYRAFVKIKERRICLEDINLFFLHFLILLHYQVSCTTTILWVLLYNHPLPISLNKM